MLRNCIVGSEIEQEGKQRYCGSVEAHFRNQDFEFLLHFCHCECSSELICAALLVKCFVRVF
jgi:hypothetical protein